MPTNRSRLEVGYTRPGFPRLMGWREVVIASSRTDTSVRQMRDEMPDFPKVVSVLSITPVWLADEVEAFFAKYPRRALINDDIVRQIQGLADGGTPHAQIATSLEIDIRTVRKYVASARI